MAAQLTNCHVFVLDISSLVLPKALSISFPKRFEFLEKGFDPKPFPKTQTLFYNILRPLAAETGQDLSNNMKARLSVTASLCVLCVRDWPNETDRRNLVPVIVWAFKTDSGFLTTLARDDDVVPMTVVDRCRDCFYRLISPAVFGKLNQEPVQPPDDHIQTVAAEFYPTIVEEGLMTNEQLGWVPVKAART